MAFASHPSRLAANADVPGGRLSVATPSAKAGLETLSKEDYERTVSRSRCKATASGGPTLAVWRGMRNCPTKRRSYNGVPSYGNQSRRAADPEHRADACLLTRSSRVTLRAGWRSIGERSGRLRIVRRVAILPQK